MSRRPTICVDFDGVIHSYTSPWAGPEVIPDPPIPGAIEWLNEIVRVFNVVILTTRAETPAGRLAVALWLRSHGFYLTVPVTDRKPAALVYVDDRAWRFEGSNWPSAEQIEAARPWNKR